VEGEAHRPAIPHVTALDGARGAAVAGVLLFHGGHLKGGYLGVDLFFTLSGFLITSLLLAEATRTDSVGLGGFWARRARRLLPALAVLLVGVALYSVTLAKRAELAQIRGDAFATIAYVANWHQVFSHQNSLALATVSSALMITLYKASNTTRVYYGTDTRAAGILLGAALAAWLTLNGPTTTRNTRITLELLGLTGAVSLAIAWTRLDGQSSTLYRGGFLLCGLAATAVIATIVHPQPGPLAKALSFKPLCQLGLISYGVYLYHWPIDVALNQQRAHIGGWPLFLLQTSVTLVVAIGSYKLIEQPIRHGKLTGTQLRKLTPTIAFGLVITLLAATNGAGATSAATPTVGGRLARFGATLARQAAPPGAERIMIVGNSVAWLLGPVFKSIHTSPPLAVLDDAIPACFFPAEVTVLPFSTSRGIVDVLPCDPSWEADVVKIFRPDVVFWVVSDIEDHGLLSRGHPIQPCTGSFNAIYERSLRNEVARLGTAGAKVVITTEAYNRSRDLVLSADHILDCDNRLRRTVASETGAQLVDLFSYICPHGQCRTTQNGVTLRPDGEHYVGPGGEIVAQWILDQVHA
jgi:peptidoglycan/LPS O-acetylase OafA/YrhL